MEAKITVADKKYRSEIDGLRAIAVMAVVFFHMELFPFTGGYIGVDVFFVISGYLITRILYREIDEGRFSIIRFYERRMRRIAPALFGVIAASLIVGYFIFLPKELDDLGRRVRNTLTMTANIYWWKSIDYFSAPPDTKPMLHMWSLGVEEQFYLFLPLILLFITLKFPRWRTKTIWALLLLSLVASIIYLPDHPPLVFFWLPFRAWELLAGSVIVFLPLSNCFSARKNEFLSILGLLLVVVPIFVLQVNSSFPGYNAIYPVLGSALIIWVGTGYQGRVARILSIKPFVYIGLISYSLYLWHWPMLVYIRYWFSEPLTIWQDCGLLVSFFIAAMISYHFIESPFRNNKIISAKGILYFTVIGAIILISVGLYFERSKGIPSRISPEVQQYADAVYKAEGIPKLCSGVELPFNVDPMGKCHLGVKDKAPTVLLLGDSFAGAISGSFSEFLEQNNQSGIVIASAACPPILGLGTWAPFAVEGCEAVQKNALKMIDKWHIKTVVLYARWPEIEKSYNFNWIEAHKKDTFITTLYATFEKTIYELQKRHINIVILESAPIYNKNIPLTMAKNAMTNRSISITMPLEEFLESTKFENKLFSLYKTRPGVLLIDLKDQFCFNGTCYGSLDNQPLYWDNGHLNKLGAEQLMPAFEKMKSFLHWTN